MISDKTDDINLYTSGKHSKKEFNNDSIDFTNENDIEVSKDILPTIDSKNNSDKFNIVEENLPLVIRTKRLATIMNLLNSQFGAGFLSVPSTFVNTGIIASIILSFAMMGISYGWTILLLILAHETGKEGFPELTLRILKKPGCTILSFLNVIFLITALAAYLILGDDMITSWFELGGVEHLINSRMKHALMIFIYQC